MTKRMWQVVFLAAWGVATAEVWSAWFHALPAIVAVVLAPVVGYVVLLGCCVAVAGLRKLLSRKVV